MKSLVARQYCSFPPSPARAAYIFLDQFTYITVQRLHDHLSLCLSWRWLKVTSPSLVAYRLSPVHDA